MSADRDDVERLKRMLYRLFARVSVLEARVRELEAEPDAAKAPDPVEQRDARARRHGLRAV